MRATYYLRQTYDNYMKDRNHPISNEESSSSSTAAEEEIVNNASIISDIDDNDTSLTVLQALTSALSNNQHGSLLRHEFAYVLGQLRDVRAVHSLECILLNEHDDTMVGIIRLSLKLWNEDYTSLYDHRGYQYAEFLCDSYHVYVSMSCPGTT